MFEEEPPENNVPLLEEKSPSTPDPGWIRLPHEQTPNPTYWPFIMALGIVFVFWGVVTTLIISLIGVVIFGISLGGWLKEQQSGG